VNPLVVLARLLTTEDARFRLHSRLASGDMSGRLYGAARTKIRRQQVTGDTELVIEGFPRSANTYAVAAFRCANGMSVRLADHLHSVANVAGAVRRNLPVVVLLREPLGACTSLIQRQHVRPATALTAYADFHAGLLPYLDRVVVSDFPTTTGMFGVVIDAVNERFGTGFSRYETTPENEAWCREFVLDADRVDQGRNKSHTVALPDPTRIAARDEVAETLRALPALLGPAEELYDRISRSSVG
jgi:hypothetical protein